MLDSCRSSKIQARHNLSYMAVFYSRFQSSVLRERAKLTPAKVVALCLLPALQGQELAISRCKSSVICGGGRWYTCKDDLPAE